MERYFAPTIAIRCAFFVCETKRVCLLFVLLTALAWETRDRLPRQAQDKRKGGRNCQKPHQKGLFEPFIYKSHLFYQDRLGTNIGKTQKKGRDWRSFCTHTQRPVEAARWMGRACSRGDDRLGAVGPERTAARLRSASRRSTGDHRAHAVCDAVATPANVDSTRSRCCDLLS